jgi:aquaporin Z
VRRHATELIGTFFLVLAIGASAVSGVDAGPLAIGSMLMAMVYMGGPISGAHYNPAVTFAVYRRGALPKADVWPYIVAQVGGAVLASLAVLAMTGETFAPDPGLGVGAGGALLGEALVTFALALVILHVATSKSTEGNSYFGLAIGFTVAAGAYGVGPISGGAFNPAVGIGPTLVTALAGDGSLGSLWLYVLGPLLGAAAAVPVFRIQTEGE